MDVIVVWLGFILRCKLLQFLASTRLEVTSFLGLFAWRWDLHGKSPENEVGLEGVQLVWSCRLGCPLAQPSVLKNCSYYVAGHGKSCQISVSFSRTYRCTTNLVDLMTQSIGIHEALSVLSNALWDDCVWRGHLSQKTIDPLWFSIWNVF